MIFAGRKYAIIPL